MAAEERTLIEARNDELVDELHVKVDRLKVVTQEVGQEASASLSLAQDMERSFDGALNVLKQTADRLKGIAKDPAGMSLIRMTMFCVLLFMFLYFVFPRLMTTTSFVVHGAQRLGGTLNLGGKQQKFLAGVGA